MTLLASYGWKLKYTPEDGDLVRLFYVPALEDAVRYDRLTGYFTADALALAARGIEGLVRNGGRMRLVVGCTLEPAEIAAIERGEQLRALVERHLAAIPLSLPDSAAAGALELLAWMVAQGILEVRVAVPCDRQRRPFPDSAIFHEKSGIIEDQAGDRIAWTGSLNETGAGWAGNWESINVFKSWTSERERVVEEEENFARIWADRSGRLITVDLPRALREDLLRFLPKEPELPARLKTQAVVPSRYPPWSREVPPSYKRRPAPPVDLRRLVWGFIRHAAALPNGGERVGEATCAVTPWPHQVSAFERLYGRWPPKLLIADEVGLGKTIQAGLLLRQAWLAGKAKRVLILAPKAVLTQWQVELREKFNLNWPIYDGQRLVWYASPSMRGREVKAVDRQAWHREPAVIASSQLLRRQGRADEVLQQAEPWDLIVLDEAHHARRRAAGTPTEGGPNALLRLMHGLKARTQGLVLLTATPMQVHPIEVWDLLSLLSLPPEWSEEAFLWFFEAAAANPSSEALDRMAALLQAVERVYGLVPVDEAIKLCGGSRFSATKVLRALRDSASVPRRQLETADRQAAIRLMRAHTPIRRLVSRHTRDLLRRYYRAGRITTPIADRRVEDRFIEMTRQEWAIYQAVEDYITSTYNQAAAGERSAVGFVMTIYRRRLASSFRALAETLQAHLAALAEGNRWGLSARAEEDVPDDAAADEVLDADEVAELQRQALAADERSEIERLLSRIRELPPDSKLTHLGQVLVALRDAGYPQVMVFTQYTDTMDFLREELRQQSGLRILCFSGRGGEAPAPDVSWRTITREDARRRFRDGEADLLLCTDAAAEGLNFQFCGALVNYDMPWNPMRVEQRIGRIDRLGQRHAIIRVVNLHYEGTIETDVYRALRKRIGLFERVVGPLQPILSRLPQAIAGAVLAGVEQDERERANVVAGIEEQAEEAARAGFDIDAVTDADLDVPGRQAPRLSLNDLDRVIRTPAAMLPGIAVEPLSRREYAYSAPGMPAQLRVTTDPEFYEENADSVELWSPGSPLFPVPDLVAEPDELPTNASIRSLLEAAG